jgi:hypothetical protein
LARPAPHAIIAANAARKLRRGAEDSQGGEP